mmetsp:Transcript_6643/g.14545  ORF Transcript_6643/g.14545 Transcript_6643/m.14545 type:complete len:282 (+) Transcript_6643:578-1423(+)
MMGQGSVVFSMLRLVSRIRSGSFVSGTHTSVIIGSRSGYTDMADQRHSLRTVHRAVVSSGLVATLISVPPFLVAISLTTAICSATEAADIPVISYSSVVSSCQAVCVSPEFVLLMILIISVSSSSQRPMVTPQFSVSLAVVAAANTPPGNAMRTACDTLGIPCSFKVASVITASVPSEPMSSRVMSYPAADFRALDPVWIIEPSASTAVRLSTLSRIEPYLTAVDPLQRQAHIPPMEAPGPGSSGNQSPLLRSISLSSRYPSPASTRTSRSSSFSSTTFFM